MCEIAVRTDVSWFLNMWQNQLLHNSLGWVCPHLGKWDKTSGAGTCCEWESHTRVLCGTVLPPGVPAAGAGERPIWEEGSAPRPDKAVTKKIIHTHLWQVVSFICIRCTYPHSKGRLSFKLIPMYPWKREPSLMVRKDLFHRALPWALARDLLYGKGTRPGYLLRHTWDSLILSQLVQTEISQSTAAIIASWGTNCNKLPLGGKLKTKGYSFPWSLHCWIHLQQWALCHRGQGQWWALNQRWNLTALSRCHKATLQEAENKTGLKTCIVSRIIWLERKN